MDKLNQASSWHKMATSGKVEGEIGGTHPAVHIEWLTKKKKKKDPLKFPKSRKSLQ